MGTPDEECVNEPDFYLASSDSYNLYEPRRVWCIRRMATSECDDLLLVRIDPPIIAEGAARRMIDLVLLAARHEGASLFPITQWPVCVYVLQPLIDDIETRAEIAREEFQIIAWAEVYETEDRARRREM